LRVLREVDVIACEDTRRTRGLLTHFDIHTPTLSYYEHNKLVRGPQLLRRLEEGGSVALVTDAGTPGISDPGFMLVRDARAAGAAVVPVPGPSAVITALSAAGVPGDRFVFDGFLPVKPGRRLNRLKALRELETTVVVYESPHRIVAALEAIAEVFGDVEIVVARELTKQFEELRRGTLESLSAYYSESPPRGEVVILIAGAPVTAPDEAQLLKDARGLLASGLSVRDVAAALTRSGAARNLAYAMARKAELEDE
jgi:16S rRNA (cytidine1402-2'-O)-methyltransferase